ncbi:PGF-CTERM sorting domain-containing protein [Methanococcoides orientis]|uniref:S-layer protein domain-containing protein n=1 Tax=Methanococcoides orientis TaxID=2822137 RepID=UPI001E2A7CEE|nr:S-layer protein domain-containing protein [Methanococcoides orientis]UGV40371.1 PGF-CTERM sorting domain-containing protein [Methanococcoides orientis]
MKRFTAIALAALMVLSFVSVASAADSVEVRGEVTGADNFEWNATNFAGFWIDLDTGDFSEHFILTVSDNEIPGEGIYYYAEPIPEQTTEFAFVTEDNASEDFMYTKIGFLAEEYVVVKEDEESDASVDTLSKILMDDDESYTMRTGESLELAEGYALTPKQIDVDGNKVWLELTKDGDFVEDKIISTSESADNDKTWYFQMDLGDKEDVNVILIKVDEVFQGQVDSLAVIEGIFQISDDPVIVETDDEFGELEVTSVTDMIEMYNDADNELDMPEDDTLAITDTLGIRGNEEGPTLWYLYTEYTEPGTYEIRSSLNDNVNMMWDASSFAGFWYDIDADVSSEKLFLNVTGDENETIADGAIVYRAEPQGDQTTEFAFVKEDDAEASFNYTKIGFLAEEYVVVKEDEESDASVDTLSKILMDDDESYTMRTGESLELAEGYALTPKQIDVDGNKVWLEITKDGDFVEDKIISTVVSDDTDDSDKTWYFQMDLGDKEDVNVILVKVDEVFQGQVDSLCVIEGIFQISDDPVIVEVDDEFGELVVMSVTDMIEMVNDDNELDMPDDDTLAITDTLGIRANEGTTLWYIYTEATVDGEAPVVEEPEDEVEEPVVEEPVVDENVTEPVVDENVTEPVVEEPVEDEGDEEPVPGFEAVFAIAGLLAVAYFVRRN